MRVPSLRMRLTLWFAASILLILSPFLAGLLVLEWRAMRSALDHHLQEDLEVAVEMLVWRDTEVSWRYRRSTDTGYDAGPQRWVEVYGLDGRMRFLRGLPMSPVIRAAFKEPVGSLPGLNTVRTSAGTYLRILTERRRIGPQEVWLRVARTESDLRANLRRLILISALAAPLAVLAAAVAGYVISGRALLPLARMAERARFISADRLSERLPVENSKDELGQLAAVFNETFARLEASFDRLKQFTADVSHELRTPLTAIRSVGEVGLEEGRTPEAYTEIIGSMLEETDRLTRLVNTLLMLSRWESGRVSPAAETLDLAALSRDVVAQLGVLAEERRVEIDAAIPGPLRVHGDAVMVRQAVTNVLDNAIKFTRDGTRVRLSSMSTRQEHLLIIDDEGPGIPVDQRTRVLDRFYRIDDDRSGAGLGLALVHRAMAVNRGRVEIDASPAGGARVTLALPRHRVPDKKYRISSDSAGGTPF